MGTRLELCILIAEAITIDADYQKRIIDDLYDNYSSEQLKNAACEYTNLILREVDFNYIV